MTSATKAGLLLCGLVVDGACGGDRGGGGEGWSATLDPSSGSSTGETTAGDGDADEAGTGDGADSPRFDLANADIPPSDPIPTCDNLDELEPSSLGCQFWAADLDPNGPLGIGVGNPWDFDVEVSIDDRQGPGGTVREIGHFVLAPRSSRIVQIGGGGQGLVPGRPHHVWPHWLNEGAALRVTSDAPITAMQIGPMGGADSWIPDASMLLPSNALADRYRALGYSAPGSSNWVAVVAIEDDTQITTPEGVEVLDQFDVRSVVVLEDVTGIEVVADRPVAVFSGGECVNTPVGRGWCDHIQEQLLPLSAWGSEYVGARHPRRVPELSPNPEEVVWRIVAAEAGTTVELTPPQPGVGAAVQLAEPGDYAELKTATSFVAKSVDESPFMLVQYMTGGEPFQPSTLCDPGPATGDPYMLQMVPVDQWLDRLPFLTDRSYARDFVVITRNAGTKVTLDCFGPIPDARFTPVTGTSYEVASIDLDIAHQGGEQNCSDGAHFLEADGPLGVLVGGVDCAASYGYPGGMSISALWDPEG